jgi:hypothetical protein
MFQHITCKLFHTKNSDKWLKGRGNGAGGSGLFTEM